VRSDQERLLDILEAIEKILLYKPESRQSFDANELVQIWTVHYLQLIGEAADRLSADIRSSNPDVPWAQIIGMRHVLVHGYFEIDQDIVWNAVINNLPALKRQVEAMLRQLSS